MKASWMSFLLLALVLMAFQSPQPPRSIYDFSVKDLSGNLVSLKPYQGKVVLVVNIASECKLTPQLKDLQELYTELSEQGLAILAFPSNDFGKTPSDEAQINSFCTQKYAITFPIFSKIKVKGAEADPLFAYLSQKAQNGKVQAPITWNFQKFLVDHNGQVIAAFKPNERVSKAKVRKAIEAAIKAAGSKP
jgi:glutathione peroxidase